MWAWVAPLGGAEKPRALARKRSEAGGRASIGTGGGGCMYHMSLATRTLQIVNRLIEPLLKMELDSCLTMWANAPYLCPKHAIHANAGSVQNKAIHNVPLWAQRKEPPNETPRNVQIQQPLIGLQVRELLNRSSTP